jgi:hypothetical protein
MALTLHRPQPTCSSAPVSNFGSASTASTPSQPLNQLPRLLKRRESKLGSVGPVGMTADVNLNAEPLF